MNKSDDRAVEEALLRRACGYNVEETVEEETERTGKKLRVTTYHIPGDVRAQIFWLRNRRPEKWRDKPESAEMRQERGISILDDIPDTGDFAGVLQPSQADLP